MSVWRKSTLAHIEGLMKTSFIEENVELIVGFRWGSIFYRNLRVFSGFEPFLEDCEIRRISTSANSIAIRDSTVYMHPDRATS